MPEPATSSETHAGRGFRLAVIGLLALLLVLGAALAWVAWPNNGKQDQGGETATTTGLAAAEARVRELGERFTIATENRRDTTPFLIEAKEIAQRYPHFAPGRTLLAQVYLYRSQWKEAAAEIDVSLGLDPTQPKVHELAGTLAFNLDRPAEAIAAYGRAVELAPDDADLWAKLGNAKLATDDLDGAREALLAALSRDARSYEAQGLLGDLYLKRGREGDLFLAEQRLALALRLVPANQGEARRAYAIKRATALMRLSRPDEARLVLSDLPASDRMTQDVTQMLVRATLAGGERPEVASLYFDRAIEDDPRRAWAWAGLGELAARAGDATLVGAAVRGLERVDPAHEALPRLREAEKRLSPAHGLKQEG